MADRTPVEARLLAAVDEQWAVDRLTELDCDVDLWPVDLAEAGTAPDAPGQEVGHDLDLAHRSQESVPVAELVTAARASALLAVRTCGAR